MVMRTRFVMSSGNSMSSSDGHRARATKPGHKPVLLQEAVESLCIQSGDTVLDATLGGAGHARAITEMLGKEGIFVGFDLDEGAIERAEVALHDFIKPVGLASDYTQSPVDGPTIYLVKANFRHLSYELAKLGIGKIDKAVFDLGWSGYQLDAGRGFSFLRDEPLSMSYEKTPQKTTLTAAQIVNEWAEESIADVIFGWGEERYSRKIARKIVETRKKFPIQTSLQLAEIIRSAVPPSYRNARIHPATRTFQALRIAVNDELGALKEGLDAAWRILEKGGRIAVISFHSIEDREVKRSFLRWEQEGEGKRITPKDIKLTTGQARKSFIIPSADEVARNPRARSAKMRVIEKNF
jgi:16S rRNA (cytosine1402-N4)-methyltransferase